MESKIFDCTLDEWINIRPAIIDLGKWNIQEGEVIELNYTLSESKKCLLTYIANQASDQFDIIIWFNMCRTLKVVDLKNPHKVLIYSSFNLQEFLIQAASLSSFLKDSKLRSLIIIDSYNTFLMHDSVLHLDKSNINEKHNKEALLEAALSRKLQQILIKLKQKYGSTIILCRKEYFPKKIANIVTATASFTFYAAMCEPEKGKLIDSRYFLLESCFDEIGNMLHALVKQEKSSVELILFRYPIEWIFQDDIKYEPL
ncbi:unnamed protein product [Blepharisma stoltei]|uniref:Uncharacterized protein n=1 Tax=Blepharisma stoltei TaxID=1481888 RepID=A0AAU9J4F6_9CILI|nr:unnamed protein product [Blepharisma stoltei]